MKETLKLTKLLSKKWVQCILMHYHNKITVNIKICYIIHSLLQEILEKITGEEELHNYDDAKKFTKASIKYY